MKRREALTGTIPARLLKFNPDDWLKISDLPPIEDAEPWEISTDEQVRHYSAALDLFEAAQDEYAVTHPLVPVAYALIAAREEAYDRFPDEPFDPSTI